MVLETRLISFLRRYLKKSPNIKQKDNFFCFVWSNLAHLFPVDKDEQRRRKYPTKSIKGLPPKIFSMRQFAVSYESKGIPNFGIQSTHILKLNKSNLKLRPKTSSKRITTPAQLNKHI